MKKNKIDLIHTALILHESYLLIPNHYVPTQSTYYPYITYLQRRCDMEGINKAIKLNKEVRLSVTRYISGDPYFVPFMKAYKDGLPHCLGPMVELIRSKEPSKLMYVLTILAVTKSCKLPIRPDIDPIIKEGAEEINLLGFDEFVKDYVKSKNWKIKLISTNSDISHLSTKSGPNGQALATGLLDLFAMPEPLVEDLITLAPNYMTSIIPLYQLGEDKVRNLAEDFGVKSRKQLIGRKLTAIEDKEGKTRIIATGEYFTQAVLKPIHECLLEILSSIKEDMTFNQTGHPKQFGNENQNYHSLDLSNATDRFPIKLQTIVLKHLSKDSISADTWERIMVGYPFKFGDKSLNYKVGQPMGFYSSWPIFTLTHHLILLYSAKIAGKEGFKDYLMLGDDIVIKDDKVAESYRSTLNTIGVQISIPKSLVSKDTFEFAKRLYHKGVDISPIPGWSLILSNSSTELAGSLTEICNRYGFIPHPESISRLISTIIGNNTSKIKLLGKAQRLVPLMYHFPYTQKGIGAANISPNKLTNFIKLLFPGIPHWPVNIYEELLLLIMSRVCEDHLIPELRKTISTYDDIIKVIKSMDIRLSDQEPLPILSIPLFGVTKRLSEELSVTYEKVMSAWIWNDINPLPFRSLQLVNPVRLTQDRNRLQLIGVTAMLVDKLKKEANLLNKQDGYLTTTYIKEEWIRIVGELDNTV